MSSQVEYRPAKAKITSSWELILYFSLTFPFSSGHCHSKYAVAMIRQRFWMQFLKDGFSSRVSIRALRVCFLMSRFLLQDGTRPQLKFVVMMSGVLSRMIGVWGCENPFM